MSCGLPMDFAEIFRWSVSDRPALACSAISATACCTTQESIETIVPNRSATYKKALGGSSLPSSVRNRRSNLYWLTSLLARSRMG